jgi:hypothetical protein
MVSAHTGLPMDTAGVAAAPRSKYAGIRFFTAQHLSTLGGVTGLEELAAHEDVLEVEMYLKPGDTVPPFGDFRSRIGHALFAADTYEEALARSSMVEAMVRFV